MVRRQQVIYGLLFLILDQLLVTLVVRYAPQIIVTTRWLPLSTLWVWLGIVCIGLLLVALRTSSLGVTFLFAGALGNACTMLRFGHVVDYLPFPGLGFVANFADMLIICGIVLSLTTLKKVDRIT